MDLDWKETPCRMWTGPTNGRGYGYRAGPRRNGRRKHTYVHRLAYEQAYGPIPPGYEVHHRCGQRACYELQHLLALTRLEHVRLHQSCQEHDEWVLGKDGRRRCLVCRRKNDREVKAAQRAVNREKYNAYMREYRAKQKEVMPDDQSGSRT